MYTKFNLLFSGLKRAHGIYTVGEIVDGKVQGKARTVAEPLTEEHWKLHLSGKQGLGVIPINDDDQCYFGALDIDIYPLDLEALSVRIDKIGLPLVVCRTKSGGGHLYLFMKATDPAPASLIRERLTDCATTLGYTGCEVFPKQSNLASEADVGNWINMPYFDADNTTRYAIKNEVALTPKQFLNFAESKMITVAELEKLKPKIDPLLEGAPPCLQHLAINGVPEGGRNTALYNYAVLCKKKFEHTWREHVVYCNNTFMDRPLEDKEVNLICNSADKKDYFYTCKQFPINECCNKPVCLTREFGIGGNAKVDIEIGRLTKIMTDPPTWIITVNDIRMELTTDDLIMQGKFRKMCVNKLNFLPQVVKGPEWDEWVRKGLDDCEIVEAPDDAGPVGMFRHYLRQFITGPSRTEDKDSILVGRVWIHKERAHFRAADLMLFLDQKRFKSYDMRKSWAYCEAHDGGHSTLTLKSVKTQVWTMPDMDMIDSDLDTPNMPEEI